MKKLCTLVGILSLIQINAQTVEDIDNLRNQILENLEHYESLQYSNKVISNEDAMSYDTACFYYDKKGELVYINWRKRSHTFHIAGDGISIIELFFLNGRAVFQSDFFYQFLNPQWHLEPDLSETKVRVIESLREYYQEDGSALVEYLGREAEGTYKDRFTVLDSIPLEEKLQRRWSDRCDDCIEEDYIRVFERLIEEK